MKVFVYHTKLDLMKDTVKITTLSNHKPGILNNYIRIGFLVPNVWLSNLSILSLMNVIPTQFATIKSPIDAVKFSNTRQLSPK
jgi:hypothetical protein